MTVELNLRTKNPDRYVRDLSFEESRTLLTLASVGHHTRILHHLCYFPATDYDTDAVLRAAHVAFNHHALLGRGDDRIWFCPRLDGTCGPSFGPRSPRGP